MQGTDLFETEYLQDQNGNYDAHAHLARIISYLGPPPRELVELERQRRHIEAEHPVINFQGKACKTVREFWGGPFFDDDG